MEEFRHLITLRIRDVIRRCFVAVIILIAGCQSVMPVQDCDVVMAIEFEGRVIDDAGNVIPDARITIRSADESPCPDTTPLKEISLVSDSRGNFSGEIPAISEGETITLSVSKQNYQDYIIYDTYVLFDEPLVITLESEN